MKTLNINDLHEGVLRSGGTTLSSAVALREYAQQRYRDLLAIAAREKVDRVIVNGDLTDTYSIPLGDAIDVFVTTREFLEANPATEMVWAEGNHDLSKDSSRLGTVGFLGQLLQNFYPGRFFLVDAPTTFDNVHIIPHLANQQLFEAALDAVPDGTQYLFLHCNFDNTFAGRQDHSLNLPRERAKALTKRGITIVLGHEHQGRRMMAGKLIIVGNQFPTSVSDCLAHDDAQKDGKKYCLLLEDGAEPRAIETWSQDQEGDGWFGEVDWRDLRDTTESGGRGFVRVTGTATAAEAADKVREISTFRARSSAFVVADAVKVEKPEGMEDLPDSIEDIQAVDVMALLYGMLEPEQAAKIRELRGETEEVAA